MPIRHDLAALVSGWVEHLSAVHWTHFVTLTFRTPPHAAESVMGPIRQFLRRLAQRNRAKVDFFALAERGRRGRPHGHGVVRAENLTVAEVREAWDRGISSIERFDSTEGGIHYLARKIALDPDLPYEMSVNRRTAP